MDTKYLYEMDIDWDAVGDAIGIVARRIGAEKIIKAIGTEKAIDAIGREKILDSMLDNLTPEEIERITEQLNLIKSHSQHES